MKRTINNNTNSYYTDEEKNYLTEVLKFSWSNDSNKSYNGYDNCMYSFIKNSLSNLEVTSKGFNIDIYIPTIFGDKHISKRNIDYKTLLYTLDFKRPIQFWVLFLTSKLLVSIYLILAYILSPIFFPLYIKLYDNKKFQKLSLKDKIKKYLNSQKSLFKRTNYYSLSELRFHCIILFIILITVFVTSLFFFIKN